MLQREKLNRLTERSLVNSNTRSITVIRGSGGHSPFYGLSTAGMKYFSGKWHPSGKSSQGFILCCLYILKRGRGLGGVEITLFLSDHLKNLPILTWCDDDCLWMFLIYTILNLGLIVSHFIFRNMSCTFCNLFLREIRDRVEAQRPRVYVVYVKIWIKHFKIHEMRSLLILLIFF